MRTSDAHSTGRKSDNRTASPGSGRTTMVDADVLTASRPLVPSSGCVVARPGLGVKTAGRLCGVTYRRRDHRDLRISKACRRASQAISIGPGGAIGSRAGRARNGIDPLLQGSAVAAFRGARGCTPDDGLRTIRSETGFHFSGSCARRLTCPNALSRFPSP